MAGANEIAWKEALGMFENDTNGEEEINWAHDFGVNEELHSTSQEIAAKYGSLFFTNQDHSLAAEWFQKGSDWADYDLAIKDLVLPSLEGAETELVKVRAAWHAVVDLEKRYTKTN